MWDLNQFNRIPRTHFMNPIRSVCQFQNLQDQCFSSIKLAISFYINDNVNRTYDKTSANIAFSKIKVVLIPRI